MTLDAAAWVALLSCVGQVALVSLLVGRGRQSPLVRPLALVCLDFFAFNAADLASRFSPARGWNLLDVTCASLLMPLVLDFFLIFTGRRRSLAWLLWACRSAFGAIALACALGFLSEPFAAFAGSDAWSEAVLAGAAPLVAVIAALLAIQHRRAADRLERRRVRIVIAAFAVGAAGCLTQLFANLGYPVPPLSAAGTLGATLLFTVAAVRFDLVVHRRAAALWLGAAAVGAAQVGAYLAVFRVFASSTAMLILGTATVTLAAAPIVRELLRVQAADRARERELALLGRLAKEMAHSFLNPLATIKGAADIIVVEQARDGSIETQRHFAESILEQCGRLERLVKDYQRLSKVEPRFERADVNELIAGLAAARRAAAPAGVIVQTALEGDLPACQLDRDLLEAALDNVVTNAFDAMPSGGTLTLRTSVDRRGVLVAIEDTGVGMEPWAVECAFDEFYTTKATGSGLGLAYVRRVAEAHGGRAILRSRAGAGTVVEISLRALAA
ncbi:MAG TPA: ATP-binding protein [Kofleriaceae bacterium]|nr:ATP-binding protein [Kofleriaceae bacterium]